METKKNLNENHIIPLMPEMAIIQPKEYRQKIKTIHATGRGVISWKKKTSRYCLIKMNL